MSLVKKIYIGMVWSFGEQLARRGTSVIVTLLLARFLVPEDFGLVAMMTVFLALGQSLTDSGFRQALIRLPEISETDYSTAFYANLMLGFVAYSMLYAAAPFIANFYEQGQLTNLIRVASLTTIINAFQVVQLASLSRNLNFKVQMQATVPSSIISGLIAIGLAYFNFGVWALVAQSLVAATIHTVILWWRQGWRPSEKFSWVSFKEMYNFGYKLFLSGSLDTLFKNLYPMVIAKAFSAPAAGLYFFADRIRELVVSQILHSIQAVTFPALAKKQASITELKRGYRRVIKVIIALFVPLVAGLILVAPWLFELLFPEDWYPAHRYLQILCLAVLLQPLNSLNLNILRVLGRSDILLALEVFKKIVVALVLMITAQISLEALMWGQVIQSVVFYFPNKYFSDRLIGYSFVEQFRDVGLYYGATAIVFCTVFWVIAQIQVGTLTSLGMTLIVSSILYVLAIFLLDKPLVKEILNVFKRV
ncbi:lipopolysaccharide biosynthesis protein [Salinivibrio sp. IB282]|uniref:lipopolysaccharide biosynthesis protein n=1 Tax=Salinivibrio sp. IB282 TaxID=1766122 RepID=UPI00098865E3|nr:lipopolysaccharide biosynthesis protein [Salinivibrio sp. IB282]OOE58073.1 lipopolysaccharide biosynthesis protein [Salinivibrio sp. IB282]